MTTNSKLYYLNHKDYSRIKETIEFDSDAEFLCNRIAVVNHTTNPNDNCYILLSNDEKIDKIIEENGGVEASSNDYYKIRINEGHHCGDFLFGNEELISFL
jgi:hypothetical protein